MLLVAVVAYWLGRSIVTPLAALTDGRRARRRAAISRDAARRVQGRDRAAHARVHRDDRTPAREPARGRRSANEALRSKNDELEALATTDSLTGLYNRKKLDEFLRRALRALPARRHAVRAAHDRARQPRASSTPTTACAAGDDVLVNAGGDAAPIGARRRRRRALRRRPLRRPWSAGVPVRHRHGRARSAFARLVESPDFGAATSAILSPR